MSFGEQQGWKSWRDIRDWCDGGGYKNIVKRMNLNDSCWNSSGEFGRSQVEICDSLRFADNEDEAKEIASELDKRFSENFGLY